MTQHVVHTYCSYCRLYKPNLGIWNLARLTSLYFHWQQPAWWLQQSYQTNTTLNLEILATNPTQQSVYMHEDNRDLAFQIKENNPALTWERRLVIAIGLCRAVDYLLCPTCGRLVISINHILTGISTTYILEHLKSCDEHCITLILWLNIEKYKICSISNKWFQTEIFKVQSQKI